MNITTETLIACVNTLIEEEQAIPDGPGPILSMIADTEGNREAFCNLMQKQVMETTSSIAEQMSQDMGVPALTVAADAHGLGIAHVALIMLAVGWRLKQDQMLAADVTDEDIQGAIDAILGGSNE